MVWKEFYTLVDSLDFLKKRRIRAIRTEIQVPILNSQCSVDMGVAPKYTSPKYYRNPYFIDLIYRPGHMQNFDLWIKSKTSFICLTLLPPPISAVDQKLYSGVYVNVNCLYSLLLSVTQTL